MRNALEPSTDMIQGTPISMSQKMLARAVIARLDRSAAGPEVERAEYDLAEVPESTEGQDASLREKFEGVLEGLEGPLGYTVADELESAAKSLLLILLPSLRRGLKQALAAQKSRRTYTDTAASTYATLWQGWDDLLTGNEELLQLCQANDYEGLVQWFTSRERLLIWQVRP